VEKCVDAKDELLNSAAPSELMSYLAAARPVAKAMFLSWLTLVQTAISGSACESALSSQKVRFAHKRNAVGCIASSEVRYKTPGGARQDAGKRPIHPPSARSQ
jgi:hypothetical protein